VDPLPARAEESRDAEGNLVTHLRFSGSTSHLSVVSALEVETRPSEPCVPEADPGPLPLYYPAALAASAARYLEPRGAGHAVAALATGCAAAARGDPLRFLDGLTTEIPRRVRPELRWEGAAQSAAQTLAAGRGACRDLAVLFMEACRAQGLAARFVSGYQGRSAPSSADRQLHAWAEVLIPGSGWRGYDPTLGTIVTDGHVALAAAPTQQGTMPLDGGFTFLGAEVRSTLDFSLQIEVQ
jgi:transglutaminase-like putative cysteine protease